MPFCKKAGDNFWMKSGKKVLNCFSSFKNQFHYTSCISECKSLDSGAFSIKRSTIGSRERRAHFQLKTSNFILNMFIIAFGSSVV